MNWMDSIAKYSKNLQSAFNFLKNHKLTKNQFLPHKKSILFFFTRKKDFASNKKKKKIISRFSTFESSFVRSSDKERPKTGSPKWDPRRNYIILGQNFTFTTGLASRQKEIFTSHTIAYTMHDGLEQRWSTKKCTTTHRRSLATISTIRYSGIRDLVKCHKCRLGQRWGRPKDILSTHLVTFGRFGAKSARVTEKNHRKLTENGDCVRGKRKKILLPSILFFNMVGWTVSVVHRVWVLTEGGRILQMPYFSAMGRILAM